MRRTARNDGFTYIEVTIILLALAILVGVLLPNIGNFNALARKVRLKEDLGVLCASLKVMLDDLGDSSFFSAGYATVGSSSGGFAASSSSFASSSAGAWSVDSNTQYNVAMAGDDWCDNCNMPRSDCGRDCMDDCNEECVHEHQARLASVTTQTWQYDGTQAAVGRTSSFASSSRSVGGSYGGFHGAAVGLLVGDGDIPRSAIGATEWQLEPGAFFSASTHGYYPVSLSFVVDTFAALLIHQDPTYGRYHASSAVGYGRGGGAYGIPDTTYRWRGPYIADRITSDPWGNRYMANVFGLHAPASGAYPASVGGIGTYGSYIESFESAVVCYSAGANESIETEFNQPYGWYTGGDDVTAVLAGAGGIR